MTEATFTPAEYVQAACWLLDALDARWIADRVYLGSDEHYRRTKAEAFHKGVRRAFAAMDPQARDRFMALAVERFGKDLLVNREMRERAEQEHAHRIARLHKQEA